MSKTIFSHLLQKDVVLDGDALVFYEEFTGKNSHRYRQSTDASHYVTLVNLGYSLPRDRQLFLDSGRRVKAYTVAVNNIRPEVANYAYFFLRDNGNNVKTGTWLSEALAALDSKNLSKVDGLERAGWDTEHAIIIAAFPDREDRLREALDNGMEYYETFFDTPYDLAMIRRLIDVPGAYFLTLKNILGKGFTEAEIKGFGYNATEYFTVAELRSVTIKPSFFKNIVSALPLREWKPSVAEVEALFTAGIKNGKQYKGYAKILGLPISEAETLEAVVTASNILPAADALEVYKKTGTLSLAEVEQISLILEDGYSIQEYLSLIDALDAKTEDNFRRGFSLAASARKAFAKGLSPQDVAVQSRAGRSFANM